MNMYVLTLTPEQENIVERAMELYARLKLGQFNRISEELLPFGSPEMSIEEYCRRRDIANDVMMVAVRAIYGENGYGQPNIVQDDDFKRAWTVYAALRYTRSWHEHPKGNSWSVCFDEPMCLIDEPMPKCEVTNAD